MDHDATLMDVGTLADHYLRLWEAGGPAPDVFAFLKTHADAPARQCADVLLVDQRLRWRTGDRRLAERYLQELPEIASNRELIIDLVYGEIHLSLESGETFDIERFSARFPELGEALARQLEVAGWMRTAQQSTRSASTDHTDHGDARGPQGLATWANDSPDKTQDLSPGGPGDFQQTVLQREVLVHRQCWAVVPGYEALSELGRGGMGIVYKALDLKLNRVVALKMVRGGSHAHPEHLARFQIEVEAVARLHHPNILQIYQIGEINGLPFVAFELLENGSLAQRLANRLQPLREAADLLATLARAMQAAHQAGIVHRDLKPSNILFDNEGIPKVADFGLAKRLEVEEGETWTGQVIGTPSYMAPEQAQGRVREIGPAADIYALGVILYEMLTGRPPFQGTTTAETLLLVQSEDPVPPSRLRPKIPRDLETICLKCLAKEPQKRYATAAALAEDLDRYLASKPIRARRTPLWERGVKWGRRRPTTTALLAVGLVAVVAMVVAGLRADAVARFEARCEHDRLNRLWREVDLALFEGQRVLAQEQWDEARVIVSRQLSRVESEPRLADLRAKAEGLLEQARLGLDTHRAGEECRARFRRFLEAKDEALFLDTRFTGLDTPVHPEDTCRAARTGLGVFGVAGPGGDWSLPPLPPLLAPQERAEVVAGCYELLLILADAVSQLPDTDPGRRADDALRILDQAARLRPSATRAYHLRRAACLAQKGDPGGESRERAEAARLAPTDAFDFFLSGRERFKRLELAAAIRDFDATLQRQPEHFWAQCLLAICHLQIREPLKARPSLNACLQRKPDTVWLYLLRGIANAQAGALALGLAQRYPDQAATLKKEATAQFESAEADYHTALGRFEDQPKSDELRYVLRTNRGLIRLDRGNLDAAATDFQEAIRLNDCPLEAYSGLGQVYQRQGRTADALEQFDRAIQLRPGWSPLHRARAAVYLGLKELTPAQREAALRDLDNAIRFESPGSRMTATDRASQARLLHQAGREEEALSACDAALKIDPRHAPAHRLRIQVLLDLKRYDDLIRSCDGILATTKPSVDLYELRGVARDALGDYPGAISDYTLALALQADNPRLLVRRGLSYLIDDAPRPALHDFDSAIRLDPSHAAAYNGRGFARARLGQHRAAVIDAEKALSRSDLSWRTVYNAARVYAQAAAAAAAEVRRTGPDAVRLVFSYQDRAVALVHQALKCLPAERRAEFLRETILNDTALGPIQKRLRARESSTPVVRLPR